MSITTLRNSIEQLFNDKSYQSVKYVESLQNKKAVMCYYERSSFEVVLTGNIRSKLEDYKTEYYTYDLQCIKDNKIVWVSYLNLVEIK